MSEYDDSHEYDTYEPDTAVRAATGWRHPVNVGHLVMGIAFLGMVLVWAMIASDAVTGEDIRWLMPIPWVAAGGAGLAAIALSARRRS